MAETTIAGAANAVVNHFKEAREIFELLRPDVEGDARPELTGLDDQFGRFNIFASNLGVFASNHASLDWRLRDSDYARDITHELLQSLQFFLRRGMCNDCKLASVLRTLH